MIHSKPEIIKSINEYIDVIGPFIANIDADKINAQLEDGKWSIAENAEHLIRSVQPINLSLSLPKISFLIFGRVKIKRNYDEVVQLYHDSLSKGGKASIPYTPKPTFNKKSASKISKAWKETHQKTLQRIHSWTEEDLDKYCLPHPLIGRLTMREMLFFTIYHIGHHFDIMNRLNNV